MGSVYNQEAFVIEHGYVRSAPLSFAVEVDGKTQLQGFYLVGLGAERPIPGVRGAIANRRFKLTPRHAARQPVQG
jgi:hypothetical protein